jgi:hypothetical protein
MASDTSNALLYPDRFISPGWITFGIGAITKLFAAGAAPTATIIEDRTGRISEVNTASVAFFHGLGEIGLLLMIGGVLLVAVHAFHDRVDARSTGSTS